MQYNDIPFEIKPYIPGSEDYFNSLDENFREIIVEGARTRWRQDGAHPSNSVVNLYRIQASQQSNRLDDLYSQIIIGSTMGIMDYRYELINKNADINVYDYVQMVRLACSRVNATNATLTFIDSDDILHYISFSKKDMQVYSPEQLLNMLVKAPNEWDKNLYSGSDYIMNVMKSYSLCKDRFAVTVSHISGGYGKMIPSYFETLGLENNSDDCLIQCFMRFLNMDFSKVDEVRKEMYFHEGKLGLDEVSILEKKYSIKVDVYEDRRHVKIKYDNSIGRKTLMIHSFKADVVKDEHILLHGDGTSKYKILFKDNHYDIITKIYDAKDCHCPYSGALIGYGKKLSKTQLIKELWNMHHYDQENLTDTNESDNEIYYYFFDYETIFDCNSLEIKPYAISICKADDAFHIIETKFYLGLDTCEIEFVKYLQVETPNQEETKYLIGYNNSRFDNYILLKSALKHNLYVGHTRFSQNSIVSMNVNNFRVRDLCRILNMPLDKACKSFKITKVKQTGLIKHEDFQFAYLDGKLDKHCKQNYDDLKTYSVADVESLCELYQKTKECISALIDLDIEEHYTLAGMSYKAFKQSTDLNLPILNKYHDDFIRKAIYGGRSQITLNKATNLVCIDCVSLYPYVMLNREYPIGKPMSTESYVEGKIGVYEVVVKSQPKYNIIPLRQKDKPLDWRHKGVIHCTLTNVDIECLKRYKCDIEIRSGLYWEESTNKLFDQYFKPIIAEKIKQDDLKDKPEYNHAVRETCKLIMNGLSGKLAQRIYTKETSLCRNASDVDRFFSRTMKDTQKFVKIYNAYIAEGEVMKEPSMPTIYGILIYAYARTYMYDMIISKIDTLYGMDTDSAFISEDDFGKLDKHIMGSEFGQFKVEYRGFDAILVAPKCYVFHKGEEIIKARFKGVSIEKDKLYHDLPSPAEGKYKEIPALDLYKLYHSGELETTGLNIYEELYKNKHAKVICNNINKRLIQDTNAIYLSNHTFIKEIKVEDNDVCIQKIDK
jgi:hypothetical protein